MMPKLDGKFDAAMYLKASKRYEDIITKHGLPKKQKRDASIAPRSSRRRSTVWDAS